MFSVYTREHQQQALLSEKYFHTINEMFNFDFGKRREFFITLCIFAIMKLLSCMT